MNATWTNRNFPLAKIITLLLSCGLTSHAADPTAPPQRLTVAMLAFADKTGDPELAHWRYSLPRLVSTPLKAVQAIRIYPTEASAYGLRQFKLPAGSPIDAAQARKIGEIIEVRRVVWGEYRRQDKQWTVTAQVMNVATGKASAELRASADDWFDMRDEIAGKIVQELAIEPTDAERAKMKHRFTSSLAAVECLSRAYALQAECKPFAEGERCARQAVTADPRCADAHVALAICWLNLGKQEEASQEILEALKLNPELANAHMALGMCLLFQEKPDAAVKELRQAIRLDPDVPDYHIRLAEYFATQGEWLQALACLQEARRLNPVSADARTHLGLVYAKLGERTKALLELKEAGFLDAEEMNVLQMMAQAYMTLHEIPLAVEHFEKFLHRARSQELNPKMVQEFADRLQQLKASLTPVLLNAVEPKAYSEQSLRKALRVHLTEEELALINFPLTSSPEMKRWALQLTQGAANDMQKARALYDALARRLNPGAGGSRTARETFADWQKPQVSFRCQEYARLYVALARDAGLKASFVVVDRDYEDTVVLHACAGVLIEGQVLLVDPTYQWFGVPHKQFVLQDDYQAVVSQLNQSGELARQRLAVKLQPDSALSQFNLAACMMLQDQWNEARLVLQTALMLDAESWMAHGTQGLLAQHDGQPERALTHLRKAVEMYPLDASIHYVLACVLWEQKQLKEARDEFRACLKYRPFPNQETAARHAMAQINEKIGTE